MLLVCCVAGLMCKSVIALCVVVVFVIVWCCGCVV